MREKDLKELNFVKEYTDEKDHYYSLNIGSFTFITLECSDEVKSDNWTVLTWDHDDLKFKSKPELKAFISLLKAHIQYSK